MKGSSRGPKEPIGRAVSSDPSVIEQYATRLQQKAGSRVTRLTALGFALGTALGTGPLVLEHVSKVHQAIPHRFAYAIILIGAAAGAYLGYILGQSRAVSLRLQASLALNQLEIERVVRRVEGIRLTLPAPPAPLPAATPTSALPAPPAPVAPPALPAAPVVSLPAPPPTVLTATPAPVFPPAAAAPADAPTIQAMPAPMLPPSMPASMTPPVAAPPPPPIAEPIQVVAAVPEPAPVAPAPAPVQPVPAVQIVPPPTFEWNAPPSSASGS